MDLIKKLNNAGIKCSVLTKGILPIQLAQLSPKNEYGITLLSLDEGFRQVIEPGAAPLKDRLEALYKLHKAGCITWVSIEPYPTPNFIKQNLSELLEAVSFCDKIIFGRLNYNGRVSEYKDFRNFYNECATQVIDFCNTYNKQYHIKNGTIT